MSGVGKKADGMYVPFVLENVPAGELCVAYGRCSGPLTVSFSADGKLVKTITLKPEVNNPLWIGANKHDEWGGVVQAGYRGKDVFTFDRPVGRFVIRIEKGDWMQLGEIRLASADGKRSATLSFESGWGKPKNFVQRFVGWTGTPFEAVGLSKPKTVYADAGQQYLYDKAFAQWDEAIRSGRFVFCGECGVWKMTPHAIVLDIMEDYLKLWKERNMGWAFWNLRGTFGVLDSERQDVDYEDFRGHKLDRKLLELMQRY